MIYIHCGWPKTGTTSLQASLVKHRSRLAAAGVVYPNAWHWKGDNTHNGLKEMLRSSPSSTESAVAEIAAIRKAHGDVDVLISAESLAIWIVLDKECEAFPTFLSEAQELDKVRCVWTMRRFDELVVSLYQQPRPPSAKLPDPTWFIKRIPAEDTFARMLEMESIAGDAAYIKYDPAGGHNAELLQAFGVPPAIAGVIERELLTGHPLNVGITHKEAIALRDIEALSSRLGIALDPRTLAAAFRGGFQFAEDRPFELVAPSTMRSLHERMLAAARKYGFEPYERFFGDAVIDSPPSSRDDADSDALTDADVNRLSAYLQQVSGFKPGRLS